MPNEDRNPFSYPTREENELTKLRAQNESMRAAIDALNAAPHPTAIVIQVREKHAILLVGNQAIEVVRPAFEVGVGDAVRITAPSSGGPSIVDKTEIAVFGHVRDVVRMLPAGLAEVHDMPCSRAVLVGKHEVRQGDRVIVDATVSVVLRSLGPKRGDLDPAIVRDGRIDAKVGLLRPGRPETEAVALRYLGESRTEGAAADLARVLAEEVFDPRRVVARVRGAARQGERVREASLLLGHVSSGALVAGIVEAAKQGAIRRLKAGPGPRAVTEADVRIAVAEKHREQVGVEFLEEGASLVGGKLTSYEPEAEKTTPSPILLP